MGGQLIWRCKEKPVLECTAKVFDISIPPKDFLQSVQFDSKLDCFREPCV